MGRLVVEFVFSTIRPYLMGILSVSSKFVVFGQSAKHQL